MKRDWSWRAESSTLARVRIPAETHVGRWLTSTEQGELQHLPPRGPDDGPKAATVIVVSRALLQDAGIALPTRHQRFGVQSMWMPQGDGGWSLTSCVLFAWPSKGQKVAVATIEREG